MTEIKKPIFIGVVLGIAISILLKYGPWHDVLFYFIAAPYYLDNLTLKSGNLVSPITFGYYIVFLSVISFSVLNEFSALKRVLLIWTRILIAGIIFLHVILTYLSIKALAGTVGGAIKLWLHQ